MSATELQNFQEAFVLALGFPVQVALALTLVLSLFLLLIYLFKRER